MLKMIPVGIGSYRNLVSDKVQLNFQWTFVNCGAMISLEAKTSKASPVTLAESDGTLRCVHVAEVVFY